MSAIDWVGLWAALQVIGTVIGFVLATLFLVFVIVIAFVTWIRS
jgi:hypothetical protein